MIIFNNSLWSDTKTDLIDIIDQHPDGLLHPGGSALWVGHQPNVILPHRKVDQVVLVLQIASWNSHVHRWKSIMQS